jgi:hypothetical protein
VADEALLRRVLFGDAEPLWDIDRVLGLLTSRAEERVAALTAGRPPTASAALRDPARFDVEDVVPADLDGDGRAEVVVVSRRRQAAETAVDVLRLAR